MTHITMCVTMTMSEGKIHEELFIAGSHCDA